MVCATLGSSTLIGWKRRSSAASFSRCLRYSSSVVAPMVCSSPRASIGLRNVAAGADLLQDLLQTLLEVTAVAGTGDERAEVERVELLGVQRLGHVAVDDVLGQALDDGGLADTGLAD